MKISRHCPFMSEDMKHAHMDPRSTPEQDRAIDDWHTENCQCVREGFSEFYCKHFAYSAEEQRHIEAHIALNAGKSCQF